MKSSSNLVVAWGFLAIVAIIIADFNRLPAYSSGAEFYLELRPAAKLARSHEYAAMYDAGGLRGNVDIYVIDAPPQHRARPFQYPPLCALALVPLLNLDPVIALLVWQGISLLALSFCVFLIGSAASKINAQGAEMADAGWFALVFFPTLLGLWNGNGDIVFGLLPLTMGYHFSMSKRFFLSGIFFSLCLFKPACLLPAFVTAFALLAHKRPRCLAGMMIGIPLVLCACALVSAPGLMAWGASLQPNLHPVFAVESMRPLRDYIANLPQSVLLMVPQGQVDVLISFVFLGVGGLAFLALHQVYQLACSLKEDFVITPLAFVTGLYLIPLVVPTVTYSDLSMLVLAGLAIFSIEWRRYSEWRLKSTVRVTAISVNAFALLVLFQPKYAYPLILMLLIIVYFRRMVEAVHLAASEHDGVEQVFEHEEFLD